MAFDFINRHNHFNALLDLFNETAKDYADELGEVAYEYAVDEAQRLTDSHIETMRKYVHLDDTKIDGNFANIREDWDTIPTFVKSEVSPFGRFDDMVKSMDEETISKEDLDKVQQWCEDWFFTAFGTYNLKYNFGSTLGELIAENEYMNEQNGI